MENGLDTVHSAGPITLGCPDICKYLLINPELKKTRLVHVRYWSRFVAVHGLGLTPDQFLVSTLYDLITKQVGPISITPKSLSNYLMRNAPALFKQQHLSVTSSFVAY